MKRETADQMRGPHMHLSGLFLYPVKSLRGCAVSVADVDALGIVGDRRFMVVDETGKFLTQRTLPRMACIATSLSNGALTLSADDAGEVRVARTSEPGIARRTVNVWRSEGLQADDCGEHAAQWLSDFLKTKCRLVRIGSAFERPVNKPGKSQPGDVVSFADAYPFLIISEASLDNLNDRLAAAGADAVPMDRFRPNLVVAGCNPFAEDAWPRIRVGDIVFRRGGPCARCVVTTTDQRTGERGKEPLRTLALYRRAHDDPSDVNFGQNLIHETKRGALRVGDAIEVLEG
jgi:hypothetical protein